MNQQLIKKVRIVFIAVLLVVFTVVGFRLFYNELRKRSKASQGSQATLLMTSNYVTGADTFKVVAKLNPNGIENLSAFELHITFDSTKVELASTDLMSNITKPADITIPSQTLALEGDNGIKIVGTKVTAPFTANGGDQTMVEISFKTKPGAAVPFVFGWNPTTVIETDNVSMQPLSVTGTTSSSSVSSSVSSDGASVAFSTSSTSYPLITAEIPVSVSISSGTQQVASAGIIFTYDTTKLTYLSTTFDSNAIDPNSIVTASGNKITLTAATKNPTSGAIQVAVVKFKPKALGKASLVLDIQNSSVYTAGTASQNILTKTPAPPPYEITIADQPTVIPTSPPSTGSGGGGTMGEITESRGDLLYINSTTFDQAPLRYEQKIKLDEGDFILTASAMVYTNRGRGVLVVVACGESSCFGGKRLNDPIAQTPRFPESIQFQLQTTTFKIPNEGKDKNYFVRLFVEDGSEADFDYVSLTNVWAGEQLTNEHFEPATKTPSGRKHPDYWEMDDAGRIFGTVDPIKGTDGSLYINSSSRQ